MDCEECLRLRQALAVATDCWIRADNAADSAHTTMRAGLAEQAKSAAAQARQALSDHEATHLTASVGR